MTEHHIPVINQIVAEPPKLPKSDVETMAEDRDESASQRKSILGMIASCKAMQDEAKALEVRFISGSQQRPVYLHGGKEDPDSGRGGPRGMAGLLLYIHDST